MKKPLGFLILWILLSGITFGMEVPVSLETLSNSADRIVRGKVMDLSYAQETNDYGDELIYTLVRIRVAESLKGDRADLVLKVEGGTWNGIKLTVSDSAEFRPGEEVLVFAKQGFLEYTPVAGSSSKYTISAGGKLQNGRPYAAFRTEILRTLQERKVTQ